VDSALLALLQIRPILAVADGRTEVLARVRTQRWALEKLLATLRGDVERHGLERVAVHHLADGLAGKALAEEIAKIRGRDVPAYLLGPVSGLLVPPGTVGAVYQARDAMRELQRGSVVEGA